MTIKLFYLWAVMLLPVISISAQNPERPFILVKPGDKAEILRKIDQQQWANDIFNEFIFRLNARVEKHANEASEFLRGMPFDPDREIPGEIPPFLLTRHTVDGVYRNLDNATTEEWAPAKALIEYLQTGIDCGIAYYLTNDEKYAQVAVDILYTFIKGVQQAEVSEWKARGGWLFPEDGFREVREIGSKVPLIYDFTASFLQNGGKPFDFVKQERASFPIDELYTVFRTYANFSVNYGHKGSNHPVLEAPNLVFNALAFDDKEERNKWLAYFLTKSTDHMDALDIMAENYRNRGDIWPETSQYLNGVASILTRLMLIVNKYDPSLRLGEKYSNVLFALPALDYIIYPNGQLVRWGDGKRTGRPPYSSYENAYILGQMDGINEITTEFSALLNKAIREGKYKRQGIEAVLWYEGDYDGEINPFKLPRTDNIVHAGIFLQRNETNRPENGLMCFVGGAHMVHGHAEGMNIELYGRGHVLGVDNGRGRYQQDIHENYSRIFAAHNTVIVNGSSRGEGGWVNLGINTVQLVAMEPKPREEAVSPYHSFSTTSFVDDKGDAAEAYQERTLALIRTSDSTGYYVDVFRSKSALPNEYHDYLYHNIGDRLDILNTGIRLKSTPDRYMANAGIPWLQNRQYRNPGWHSFEDVQSSEIYKEKVIARFTASHLDTKPIHMDLHIPGFDGREYTSVMAPPTFEAPDGYAGKPTPTLLIRKNGEAWKDPFVLVFEPYEGSDNSIQNVEKLEQEGKYMGVKVTSRMDNSTLIQYILTPEKDEVYVDKINGFSFNGTFATITTDNVGKLLNMYMGDGMELTFGDVTIKSNEKSGSAFFEWKNGLPMMNTRNDHVKITIKRN